MCKPVHDLMLMVMVYRTNWLDRRNVDIDKRMPISFLPRFTSHRNNGQLPGRTNRYCPRRNLRPGSFLLPTSHIPKQIIHTLRTDPMRLGNVPEDGFEAALSR
ncbi:Separin [Fusarium oxysporum f. sp. albedinis]|nr:Separin [Fusarium oxysporum f. sp. albedinis]